MQQDKPSRLVAAKLLREDWDYIRTMQKRMVMQDGKARGLAVVLHTILDNARFIVDDENLIKEPPK